MGDNELLTPDNNEDSDILHSEPQVTTYNLKEIATFLKDMEITIPSQYTLNDYFRRSLHEIYQEEDDNGIKKRKTKKIDDIPLPIGIDRETLRSFLGRGKYNFYVTDISGKFVTSKLLDFGEINEKQEVKKMDNDYNVMNQPPRPQPSNSNEFLSDEIKRLRGEIETIRREREAYLTDKMKFQNEAEKLSSEKELIKQQYENEKMRLQDDIARVKRELEAKEQKVKDAIEDLKEKKQELASKNDALEKAKEEKNAVNFKNTTLEMQLKGLESNIDSLKDEIGKLKSENLTLQSQVQNSNREPITDKILEMLIADRHSAKETDATVKTEEIKSKTSLEQARMDMFTQILLAQAESGAKYEDMPPEKKNVMNDLMEKFLPNFIGPIKNVLEKTGMTIVKQDEIKKMMDESEKIGAAKVAAELKERITKKKLPKNIKKPQEVTNEK